MGRSYRLRSIQDLLQELCGETMGSNDVVSIRVEALGVSITIADGSIAIEQTRTQPAAGRDDLKGQEARAAPKVMDPGVTQPSAMLAVSMQPTFSPPTEA